MIGIYKITSSTGRIYIGSSKNIKKRTYYYSSLNCKKQIKLYNSIKKHGWENHKFEIVEECLIENLKSRERFHGDLNSVLDENKGLNLILPKEGELSIGVSDETRKNMSESKKGIKNSFYGKTHTQETKNIIRILQTGRKHTEEHKRKVSKNSPKILSKIVIDLETGVFYTSAKEASEYYTIKHSTLRSQLNGTNRNSTNLIYA